MYSTPYTNTVKLESTLKLIDRHDPCHTIQMDALGHGNFNTEIGISVGDVRLSIMVDYVIGGREIQREDML